jgi:type IV pilus assembly protein PilC
MSQQKSFNALLVSLIEAGEEGGMLGQALEQSAVLLEKQEQLRSKIRSALFYPGFVMFFAVAIVIFFFMFLVPKFEEVFATLSIELPEITLVLFAMGNWFSRNWYTIALIVLGIIFGIHFLNKNKSTKGTMDRIKLKIPVMKDLLMKASMARSSRTLSALTAAGVPIVRGIEMAEETAGNEAVKDGYKELRTSVVRGVSLGDAAKNAGIFPVLVSQMMRIGEETGHLDAMLERVAMWYDQELDEQVKATVSLLEPVMIVFVGGIIAVIAVSIFAPITSAIVQLS